MHPTTSSHCQSLFGCICLLTSLSRAAAISELKKGVSDIERLLVLCKVDADDGHVVNALTAGAAKKASERAVENFIVVVLLFCILYLLVV